jgi:hypothetical protein
MMPRIHNEQMQRVMAEARSKLLPAGLLFVEKDAWPLDDLLSAVESRMTRHTGSGLVRPAQFFATVHGLAHLDRRESPRGRQTD